MTSTKIDDSPERRALFLTQENEMQTKTKDNAESLELEFTGYVIE